MSGNDTYASYDLEKDICIRLGQPPGRIHFVNMQRNGTSPKLLDQQMAEKIIIFGEVAHVHDLCGTPC